MIYLLLYFSIGIIIAISDHKFIRNNAMEFSANHSIDNGFKTESSYGMRFEWIYFGFFLAIDILIWPYIIFSYVRNKYNDR